MVLIWNDINAFRRHMENMKTFSQSHAGGAPVEIFKLLKEIPQQLDSLPSYKEEIADIFIDTRGKVALVPIWGIALPKGSQN